MVRKSVLNKRGEDMSMKMMGALITTEVDSTSALRCRMSKADKGFFFYKKGAFRRGAREVSGRGAGVCASFWG